MYKVFLDPGHGGSDSGAVYGGLQEKNLTLDIADRIKRILENDYTGVQVKMSRTGDVYVGLSERADMANKWGADLFVSIHINAGGGTGFESFVYNGGASKRSYTAQDHIHREVMRRLQVKDRGKKSANFAVLRETRMPAVLTENLFIDNANDHDLLRKFLTLQLISEGHAVGIANYFGLTKKKEAPKMENQQFSPHFVQEGIPQKVVEYGISNGSRPKDYATREEVMAMMVRLYEKLKG